MKTDNDSISARWQDRIVVFLFWGAVLTIAFQPIAADDLYWHLSRGREVFRGTLDPSARLISPDVIHEHFIEADWAGGVPAYAAWWIGGLYGLSTFRLLTVLAVAALTWKSTVQRRTMLLWVVAGLFVLQGSFDPTPLLFDSIFTALAWHFASNAASGDTRKGAVRLLVLFALWVNLAPRILIGLIVVPLAASAQALRVCHTNGSMSGRQRWISIGHDLAWLSGAAFAGSLCSPTWIHGLADSARFVMPCVFIPREFLSSTQWAPLVEVESPFLIALFCLVSIAATIQLWRRGLSLMDVLGLASAQLLAWNWASNLAPVTAWMLSILLSHLPPKHSTADGTSSGETPGRLRCLPELSVVAVVLGIVLCVWNAPHRYRIGFGLHPSLDNRLLEMAFENHAGMGWGIPLALETRSVGMMCWTGFGSQFQDIPERALVAGRFSELRRVERDLRERRRNSYRRHDESTGGWWRTLKEKEVKLLAFPIEDVEMIAALEPTVWKPLVYDSPILIYARVDDPGSLMPRVLRVLEERDIMNWRAWQFTPPTGTGSPFDRDCFGFAETRWPAARSLQAARVMRAMKLPIAALRVLHSVRREEKLDSRTQSRIDRELRQCHLDLAWSERIGAGKCSRFRLELLRRMGAVDPDLEQKLVGRTAAFSDHSESTKPGRVSSAVSAYLRSDLETAIDELSAGRFLDYDVIMLRLENGDAVTRSEITAILNDPDARASFVAGEYPSLRIQLEQLRDILQDDPPPLR